jgi:polyhydroxybutyrate depolymerase
MGVFLRAIFLACFLAAFGCSAAPQPGHESAASHDGRPTPARAATSRVVRQTASTAAVTKDAQKSAAPDCSDKEWNAGDIHQTWNTGGLLRSMYVHVPESYDPSVPTQLVLNFHGFTMNDDKEAWLTGMNDYADQRGFIVVYPQGVFDSWNGGDCCGDAWTGGVDDVAFTRDILAQVQQTYCIDPARIFAAGFSNGGFLTFRLACEMADTFAAIGNVEAAMGMDPEDCHPSRPVPVYAVHGTGDIIVPYDGGTPIVDPLQLGPLHFRSFPDTIAIWRAKDGCTSSPAAGYANGDASCDVSACAAGSEVVSCTIDGGGHQWPGGPSLTFLLGHVSQDLDSTGQILAFFDKHPMH